MLRACCARVSALESGQRKVSVSIVVMLLAGLLVFWALGAYNRLVRLRAQVVSSWQALAQLWQAQAQAVGLRLEQFAQGRESESQWASLSDDALRWRPLTLAARQFLACLAAAQAKPMQLAKLDDVSSVRAAHDIFFQHWQRLHGEQEDLAGTPIPPDLLQLMAQHEPLIQERLRDYNQAVAAYHQAIGQFPAMLLAWLFGFGMTGDLTA
jgi:LemA protein